MMNMEFITRLIFMALLGILAGYMISTVYSYYSDRVKERREKQKRDLLDSLERLEGYIQQYLDFLRREK